MRSPLSLSILPLLLATSPRHVLADDPLTALLHSITSLGQSAVEFLQSNSSNSAPQTNPGFDPVFQHVDVSGVHAWAPPGPNDARGPCPGLNALANHGYLPRNGYATIVQLTSAVTEVYNMGIDLATILSAYGGLLDGAGAAWSIGGGEHTGIGGSRGNYETDNSPMRGDLNQYGSNTDLVMSQFQQFFDLQPDADTANYDLDVLGKFRGLRWQESVEKNPNFYYGPFSGVGVSQAAYAFIYRLMANHTPEYPAGLLNQEVLKSFFSISGSADNLTWTPGYERIPDNWYRRAQNDAYGLKGLSSDSQTLIKTNPQIGKPGCNQGRVNSFVTFNATDTDPADYDFSDPMNALCFGLANVGPATNVLGIASAVVGEIIIPFQNALGCKTVKANDETIQQACPGYSLYGGPTGPVVQGAIQN